MVGRYSSLKWGETLVAPKTVAEQKVDEARMELLDIVMMIMQTDRKPTLQEARVMLNNAMDSIVVAVNKSTKTTKRKKEPGPKLSRSKSLEIWMIKKGITNQPLGRIIDVVKRKRKKKKTSSSKNSSSKSQCPGKKRRRKLKR